jgi:BirA family transcriptional regulator, biotin operon repressor / biotin---[acetyl-CoA-carboxylase] ligase
MTLVLDVLQRLAAHRGTPGAFVSGAELAADFGVTRSAVWKAIGRLRAMGTQVDAVTNRGYRLTLPTTPLDAATVRALLPAPLRAALREGECAGELDSTNARLLARAAPPAGQFDFLTAEFQSAGRGRRGRSWLAPPGGAVCLSWSWSFEGLSAAMGSLSLAIGVSALRALRSLGIEGVQLKWPNDLVTPEGKLGGILIEMRTESGGPVHVVVGIGLNIALPAGLRATLAGMGTAAADLALLAAPAPPPARASLTAALLAEGIGAMREFALRGFAPFLDEYQAADALRDRPVRLQGSGPVEYGIARGVDTDGALRIEHGGQVHRIIAGEVSVRTAST